MHIIPQPMEVLIRICQINGCVYYIKPSIHNIRIRLNYMYILIWIASVDELEMKNVPIR